MQAEFTLELCFIRINPIAEKFADLLENELEALFAGIGKWTIKVRQEGQLAIALGEVNGIWSWETEAMVAAYLDQKASRQFWEWLQGYHIHLELKQEATQSFCQLKPKATVRKEEDLCGLGAEIIAI